jgi:hypothetical protein
MWKALTLKGWVKTGARPSSSTSGQESSDLGTLKTADSMKRLEQRRNYNINSYAAITLFSSA